MGAVVALGVFVTGGQAVAAQLTAAQVASVDDVPPPAPGDGTETTDDPSDGVDEGTDEGTDGTSDEGTDEAADDSAPTEDPAGEDGAGDAGPASVNYGHVLTAWLDCAKAADPAVDCGGRPHPPGVATGWEAAHAKDHTQGHAKHPTKQHPSSHVSSHVKSHVKSHGSTGKGGHGHSR